MLEKGSFDVMLMLLRGKVAASYATQSRLSI